MISSVTINQWRLHLAGIVQSDADSREAEH
jgi:hypothetical protein